MFDEGVMEWMIGGAACGTRKPKEVTNNGPIIIIVAYMIMEWHAWIAY